MKEIIKSKYAPYFLTGLILTILCAWLSKGFYRPDEHFQILEFCNYKLGHLKASQLSWEFQQKIRPALLPGIAYSISNTLDFIGRFNPFVSAFLLRLLTGVGNWFIICKLSLMLIPKFKTPNGEKVFILMNLFLWVIPFLSVRFTSENISGILLLYGVYFVLSSKENNFSSIIKYSIAGLLFGFSFFVRFPVIFAIAGFLAWLVFMNKTKWKYIFVLAISFVIAIGINIVVDHWFYGQWTFTLYNYFIAFKHTSVDFGTSPWWFYFYRFLIDGVPPLSIILLIMFFVGLAKNVKDPLVWAIIPFIAINLLIGYKELRFLFPVTFIFIYITALGLDYMMTKEFYAKIHKYVYVICVGISFSLLIYKTFIPANTAVNYCEYLYNHARAKNTILINTNSPDEHLIYGLSQGFYNNPNLTQVMVDSNMVTAYLQSTKPGKAFIITNINSTFISTITGYKTTKVYCFYPDWLLNFRIANWHNRKPIECIYQFDKIE